MLREGLIAGRGQILWIALLVATSVWIVRIDGDAAVQQPAPAQEQP